MDDLKDSNGDSLCWKDCQTMMDTLLRYGFTADGPNAIIFNDTLTIKMLMQSNKSLKMRMMREPDKKFLIIYVLAGHGMIGGGKQ